METESVFLRLLDASATALAPECIAELGLPDDELHREILLPLLPAMITDKTIRSHWHDRAALGIIARMKDGAQPRWRAEDFEIHVTASYLAGADARALADTLLSEAPLRELTAAVLNTVLAKVWTQLTAPPPQAVVLAPPEPEAISLVMLAVPRRFLSKRRRFLNKTHRYSALIAHVSITRL